ncbi:sulfatase-like hydrolase/transferase [Chitinophaga sp. G-6-1-13]|uniref:Sulfatase-like hydrolase/transferase n=1 Tax=Chitinophaga fulva TaxID=2728842 RepID=A0A848GM50_9BACT|nr:sulfatase/phosphatase domain-containing protein [Chitinophaga fulva]NML39466.1 sulfatase-like hydrolase/transferase [Chitinophaga fulva]
MRSTLFRNALGCCAGLAMLCSCAPKKPEKRPNIIFIMTDDHTTRAMSCYDTSLVRTPNLDRLAREGMLFRNCFVTNAVCGPSRATILTGKYNHINGLTDNAKSFDSSQVIYPQLLHQAGYQTAMIGKWHLGSLPVGFDYYSILPNQGEYYQPSFIENGDTIPEQGYVTDVITDKAIRFLEHRNKQQPYLLIYQHKAPHRNWMPAIRDLGIYDSVTFPEPPNLLDDFSDRGRASKEQLMNISTDMWDAWDLKIAAADTLHAMEQRPAHRTFKDSKGDDYKQANNKAEDLHRFFQVYNRLTPAQKAQWNIAYAGRVAEYNRLKPKGADLVRWKYQQYMRDYLACVKAVDDNVGRLLKYLEETGELDNTIIVYTSDQGFFLGEHGFFDKRMMYEECYRMPLLVRYPPGIRPGSTSDAFAMNVDFAPTLLDYAGVPIPTDMQGKSLKPLLAGNGQAPAGWRTATYYHYYEYPSWHMVKRHYGIRTARYKLIHFYNDLDEWELYDLQQDPHEMKNQYGNPAYSQVTGSLKQQLLALQQQYKDTNPTEK